MKLLFFLFTIYFSINLYGQKLRIISKSDGKPIQHVRIFNNMKNKLAESNEKGEVDLAGFSDADSLNFTHISFLKVVTTKQEIAKSDYKLVMTDKIISLDEVVFSANKIEESKKNVAQQIMALTSENISNSQSQSTADLLQGSANILVQKSQMGGGSPVIRGFEASRILLVVDGVRMNNIIYRSGHLQNIVTLDNNSLERMEVLFGPSSTIYGSDALGGVIHLFTKSPLLAATEKNSLVKVNTLSRYGSVNNEITNHVDCNFGFQKFASFTSFTYSKFGDLRGGTNQNPFYSHSYGERPFYVESFNGKDSLVKNSDRYRQIHTGFSQYDVLQKFLFQQTEFLSHSLNLQFSNSTNVPRYDRLTDPSATGLKSAQWYYGPQTRLLSAYDCNLKNSSAFFERIHLGINFQRIEESRHSRSFGSSYLSHRIENVEVLGINSDFQKNINLHNIHFGFDGQYNSLKSTANLENIINGERVPLDTRYPDGKNSMMNTALYLSHTWKISDQLIFNDGIRGGYTTLHSTFVDTTFFKFPYNSADQSNFVYSGSMGLVHHPSDDWKISLLLSTGFRTPNVEDLCKIFESSSGNIIVPNKDLKPEKTINTELGITKVFNQDTRWENSVFYTQFMDAIVTDIFKFNGSDSIMYEGTKSRVLANQNKGKAYIYGYSSSLVSQCNEHFLFSVMMNYTFGRIKTDSSDAPLGHIPPFMARLQLTYTNKNFSSDFSVNYNAWKRMKDYYLNGEDNEQYATLDGMPAWLVVNLRASYKIHQLFTVLVGVDNIFDTQYRTFASGINAPGRNIFASVKFHF